MKFAFKKRTTENKYRHVRSRMEKFRFILPVREWGVGLLLSLVLFAFVATYAGITFYLQWTGVDTNALTEEEMVQYRREAVPPILDFYRSREARFDALRKESQAHSTLSTDTPKNSEPIPDRGAEVPLAPSLIEQ